MTPRRSAEPPQRPDTRVERERRERARRERERRRAEREVESPKAARAQRPERAPRRRRQAAEPVAATAVAREQHEGLVGWLSRSIANIPNGIARILRGFALEVVAVVAGSLRGVLRLVPGGARVADAQRTIRDRASVVRASLPVPAREVDRADDDAPLIALPGRSRRRELTEAELRARDRRRATLRRRLRLAAVVCGAIAFMCAWIFVPKSDAFRIRHVEVTGASSVGDLEARALVDELLRGKTVFTVDEDAVARRLEELPFVRSARVERHLPGGLELHVVEYRPLALAYGDHHWWLVSKDGRILSKASAKEWQGRVPTVTLEQRHLKPGVYVNDEPALRLLTAREAGSTLVLESVRYEEFRIFGRLEGDIEVRFGGPTDLRQKVLVAELMLREARRKDLELVYIDVSVPSRPAICSRSDAGCLVPRESRDDENTDASDAATTPEESGGDELALTGDGSTQADGANAAGETARTGDQATAGATA